MDNHQSVCCNPLKSLKYLTLIQTVNLCIFWVVMLLMSHGTYALLVSVTIYIYIGNSCLKLLQDLTLLDPIWRIRFLWSFLSPNLSNHHISDTYASSWDPALILRMWGRSIPRMALHHPNTSTDTAGAQCTGRHLFGAKLGQNLQASCGRGDGGGSRDNVRGGGRTEIEDITY
jgi:hypothetical protein